MSDSQPNPYESGAVEARTDCGGSTPKQPSARRFRWYTIPAVLSWFISLLLFVCAALWVYQIVIGFDSFPRVATWMLAAIIAAGVLNLYSGRSWLDARWLSGLSLNLASFVLFWLTATVLQLYIKSR